MNSSIPLKDLLFLFFKFENEFFQYIWIIFMTKNKPYAGTFQIIKDDRIDIEQLHNLGVIIFVHFNCTVGKI